MEKSSALSIKQYQQLLWEIMKQIKFYHHGWGHQRIEPNGVHFIYQGQALVLDEQRIWVQLCKGDCFGLSPLVKSIVSVSLI